MQKIKFINMQFHFFIYRFFAYFLYNKFYYINAELYDKFPAFQSNFAIKFFKFIIPLNLKKNNYTFKYVYKNIIIFLYTYLNMCFLNILFYFFIFFIILKINYYLINLFLKL